MTGSITLLGIAASLALAAPSEAAAGRKDAKAVTQAKAVVVVGRYRLQSSPWVNLHQRLMHEARFQTPPAATLSGGDLSSWKEAVEAYRTFLGKRNPIFEEELKQMNAVLGEAKTELPASIPEAAASVLRVAMPLYRSAQWDEDDRANRFWITVAKALLESAGEELVAAHEKAYGMPFPKRILVDVTSFAWEFGAYTVGDPQTAHAVISSVVPGNQGFGALESLLHEPSHAIVAPDFGAIGGDLSKAAAELGVKPRWNLWHAILFYTSSELTRRWLASHGVKYEPFMIGMYERGFRDFRKSLETHWQAYLDGKIAREAAIRQILIETTSAPAKE